MSKKKMLFYVSPESETLAVSAQQLFCVSADTDLVYGDGLGDEVKW